MKDFAYDSRLHSRDNEAEADRQGFVFMKNAGFDCTAIQTTLELLNNIDKTLLFEPLNLEQVFNFTVYPFKKKWTQQESSIFSKLDNSADSQPETDSLKTHPDCTKRITFLKDSFAAITRPGQLFIVNEEGFNGIKKSFFPEITEECYREENLSRNLYYSLLLLQDKDDISLGIYSVARCLNRLYDNQKKHT